MKRRRQYLPAQKKRLRSSRVQPPGCNSDFILLKYLFIKFSQTLCYNVNDWWQSPFTTFLMEPQGIFLVKTEVCETQVFKVDYLFLTITYFFPPFSLQRYGKIYLKTSKNFMEKGADYAKNEIQRLERILEKVLYMTFFSHHFEYESILTKDILKLFCHLKIISFF